LGPLTTARAGEFWMCILIYTF